MSQFPPPFPNQYPQPLPVVPLQYGTPLQGGRPGIITAMGVMSIILACLSGLSSLWLMLMSFGMYMASQIQLPPMPTPTQSTSGTVMIGGIPVDPDESADGLAEPMKTVVGDALSRGRNFDLMRREQLDLLIAVSGQKMFPFVDETISPKAITADITESGRLPSVSGSLGADYFVIGTGRIEVYDDHAVFRPDGSTDIVSVSANDNATTPTPVPASPSATSGNSSSSYSSSTATFTGPDGTTTTTITTKGGRLMPSPFSGINPLAAVLTIAEAMISLLLAIYLFVIGILVLRDSPKGGRLHWIYVWIKIPLVILGAAAGAWMWSSFMNNFAATTPPGGPPMPRMGGVMIFSAVIGAAIALAYPVGLIFVLCSRTARSYYGSIREA